ncbi:hypothetical protein QZH41_018741, partial [Actinostola sp. cb2023]
MKLLLTRAGIFSFDESHASITVQYVRKHRADYGIRWRCRRVRCSVPQPLADHKSATNKATRRVNSMQSSLILSKTGQFYSSWI